MKKIVFVCGIISGLIVASLMVVSSIICSRNENYDIGMVMGYTSMILAFSLIFVGIKNYRDKYNSGFISFGKAFKIGLYITLIASTFYVVTWLIENYFFMPGYIDKYSAHMLNKLKAAGAGPEEMAKKTKEMADFALMYKNPFFKVMMTYVEVLPVGLLVTLISSLILKRKVKAVI